METKLISYLSLFIENKIPGRYLSKLQEILLNAGIFTVISELLALIIIFILFLETIFLLLIFIFNFSLLYLLVPFLVIPMFISYIMIQQEKRANKIEKAAPDFLRQLSSILKVGLSFENAMEDLSKYGSGSLYDEIRRTIIEIKMGRNFDEAWMAMVKRLNSKELKRIFIIILEGRKSGSSLSNVIMDVSNDLRDILALKRERKSSVMMAVMFLIISAVVASPFSLGMVSVYGAFMESFGKNSSLIQTAPIAGQIYLIIHSILVGMIISVIMYGDFKKGIKFSIPLALVSYLIFYVISNFSKSLLLF